MNPGEEIGAGGACRVYPENSSGGLLFQAHGVTNENHAWKFLGLCGRCRIGFRQLGSFVCAVHARLRTAGRRWYGYGRHGRRRHGWHAWHGYGWHGYGWHGYGWHG